MSLPARSHPFPLILAALLLGTALSGCFNPFDPLKAPTRGFSKPAPEPTSPIGVLRLYEWCWNKRDPDVYRILFTDDYQFQFAQTDSAGNAYRNRPLGRQDEIDIATNIFVRGTATEPPPASISLTFDANLVALPDSRRGKNERVHKEIAANTLLRIEQPDIEVQGVTRFFVVRGDSAVLPDELLKRFGRDSTRWYIERIDDETLNDDQQGTVRAALGTRSGPASAADYAPVHVSWGRVRAFWDFRNVGVALKP